MLSFNRNLFDLHKCFFWLTRVKRGGGNQLKKNDPAFLENYVIQDQYYERNILTELSQTKKWKWVFWAYARRGGGGGYYSCLSPKGKRPPPFYLNCVILDQY